MVYLDFQKTAFLLSFFLRYNDSGGAHREYIFFFLIHELFAAYEGRLITWILSHDE